MKNELLQTFFMWYLVQVCHMGGFIAYLHIHILIHIRGARVGSTYKNLVEAKNVGVKSTHRSQ